MAITGFVAGPGRKWHIPIETPAFSRKDDTEGLVLARVECEEATEWQRWRDRPGKEGICRNCIQAIERRQEARRQAQKAAQGSAEEIAAERKRERRAELAARIKTIVPAEHAMVGVDGGQVSLEQDSAWLRMTMLSDDDGDAPLLDRRDAAELVFFIGEFARTGRLPTRAWLGEGEHECQHDD